MRRPFPFFALSIFHRIILATVVNISCIQLLFSQYTPPAYGSAASVNYIRTWEVKYPQTNAATIVANTDPAEVLQTTQYFDGLGRPIQTVVKQGSPLLKDQVSANVYDHYRPRGFPVFTIYQHGNADGNFKLNPFQQQNSFYTTYLTGQSQTWFYDTVKFEPSPMNRIAESYAAGNSWAGTASQGAEANRHGVDMRYSVNTITDSVQYWRVADGAVGTFGTYTATAYAAGELTKLITEDEHGGAVIEFKDKEGKIVLKKVLLTANRDLGAGQGHEGFLNTYYIYDSLNRLRCVIQPQGVKIFVSGGTLTATILNEQCFRYEYDGRNRMILKKVPGAGKVEMVYDARDRLVMLRDSVRAAPTSYWQVFKYDSINRLKQIGLWQNSGTRATHQTSAANSITYPTLAAADVLQENYYDNYSWVSGQAGISATLTAGDIWSAYFEMTYNTAPLYAQEIEVNYNPKGKITGQKVRILGQSLYLHSVNFYDSVGRVVQVRSANVANGFDIVTTQYDFSGRPIRVLHRQDKPVPYAKITKELTRYVYDHAGRVDSILKRVSTPASNTERLIAANEYDELGKLKSKTLGNNLETQTYDYNVRGWLLGANRASLNTSVPTSKFSYELGYDNTTPKVSPGSYGTASYRGDICGMLWRSIGDGENRKYNFTYDGAHRLLKADFTQFNGSAYDVSAGVDYSVTMGSGIDSYAAYDLNGNILKMVQKGFKVNSSPVIDFLTYTYGTNSNKLIKIVDTAIANSKLGDFKDGINAGDDYAYDGNGNLTKDRNKGIDTILYTHLNTPYEIRMNGKGKILYTYDNLGNKLKKEVFDSTGTTPRKTVWMYMQNFVYKNDTIEYFGHEEGRARYDTTEGGAVDAKKFDFDYFIKDHLGNVRMVLTEEKDTVRYITLSFEDSAIATQNAIWENKTGCEY